MNDKRLRLFFLVMLGFLIGMIFFW